ncbi:hypothetical protein [Candidatus Williamhamiltonella defendens]|nr:hypothetical protein [Candidatus Hamiltonella defensa]
MASNKIGILHGIEHALAPGHGAGSWRLPLNPIEFPPLPWWEAL